MTDQPSGATRRPSPAEVHNAFFAPITGPIHPDARFCRYHGWVFDTYNAGGRPVCHECMLEDGAAAIYTPDGVL